MAEIEQAELETEETNPQEESTPPENISSVLRDALKGMTGTSEDASQTEEDQAKEQAGKKPESTLYAEIVLDEAKKIGFKNEKEFHDWLEKNPFLKEQTMLKSDYTRKRQVEAQERKKFEEERAKFQEEREKSEGSWGKQRPTDQDMSFFHDFWNVFQHGSDQLASKIAEFAQDISLLANGRVPVGPLAQKSQDGGSAVYSQDAPTIKMQREFDRWRSEQERREQELKTKEFEFQVREELRKVNDWVSQKEKEGIQVTPEERQAMADFTDLKNADGMPLGFDELYKLALTKLGRMDKFSMKKAVSSAKEASRKTPLAPSSRISANVQPEGNTFRDVLMDAQTKLREG